MCPEHFVFDLTTWSPPWSNKKRRTPRRINSILFNQSYRHWIISFILNSFINGQSQKSRKRKRESAGKWYSVFEGCWNPGFLIWRDHCGRPASCHLKGRPQTPATTGEKHDSWGQMRTILANAQAGECLVSVQDHLMLETIQGGKKKFWCTHTKKCQSTHCKNNTQQAQSLDVREWSTAKIKLMPQGQRDRLHWRKRTVRNKFVPRGPKTSIPLRRAL